VEQVSKNQSEQYDSPAEALDLRVVVNILSRRRWVFAVAWSLVFIAGTIYTLRSPKIYRAQSIVLIEHNPPQVLNGVREVYDMGNVGWDNAEFYNTQYLIMRSPPVMKRAADLLGYKPKELIDVIERASKEDAAGLSGQVFARLPEWVQKKLTILGMNADQTGEQLVKRLEKLSIEHKFRGLVRVKPLRASRLSSITVEHQDPEFAAALATAVADAYVAHNLDNKLGFTRTAVDWLSTQRLELKDQLEDSSRIFQSFKEDNNIISVSIQDLKTITSQSITQLNGKMTEVVAERIVLESRRDSFKQLGLNESKINITQALSILSGDLGVDLERSLMEARREGAMLALKYTAKHPLRMENRSTQSSLEADIITAVRRYGKSLERQYGEKLSTEARLEKAIERANNEALIISRNGFEYNRLRRQQDNSEELYDLVLKREKEAQLTQGLRVNNVSRHEAARLPRSPVKPRVAVNLMVFFLLGMAVGVSLVVLFELLDASIKNQEQIQGKLGLGFLGIVPQIKVEKGQELSITERDQYVIANPRSAVAECCRTIRTNLMFMSTDNPLHTLVVTSTGPREGKSTTATSLAITMAQAGARTLLIDTDMRRPRLHRSFQITNDVGISSLILGQVDFSEAIQDVGVENLDVMTCGPIPPNPAELLHTQAFARIMEDCKHKYDRVIFDSPPVGAVTDPVILGSMVDGLVLVVKAGETSWRAAAQAKERIEAVGGNIMGAVLNSLDLDDKSGAYGYSYYYYDKSGYTYGVDTETDAAA
jgi:polysaccharide biosynthesis transport protein